MDVDALRVLLEAGPPWTRDMHRDMRQALPTLLDRLERCEAKLKAVLDACMVENRSHELGMGGRRWDCKLCGGPRHKPDCPVPKALAPEDHDGN